MNEKWVRGQIERTFDENYRLNDKSYDTAEMIYKTLPELITSVAYSSFSRFASISRLPIEPKDYEYVKPYLDEMERVFNHVIKIRREELKNLILKCSSSANEEQETL